MRMASREKYIFQMLFWAFHITSRIGVGHESTREVRFLPISKCFFGIS